MSTSNRGRATAQLLVTITLCACALPGGDQATELLASARPSYATLARLPDWSGAWSTFFGPIDLIEPLSGALKPVALAQFRAILDKYKTAQTNLRAMYCRPYLFGGFSEGAEGDIEFLFTPGRVTLIWEGGLVRRIYTDGRVAPVASEPDDAGASIGHWDGSTLVVKTRLNSDAAPFFGYLSTPNFRVGENAQLEERIFLKEPGLLEMNLTLDAPTILTRPVKLTVRYRRDRHYLMGDYTRCPEYDPAVDGDTGHIRYKALPPPDLPPPPSR